MARHAILTLLLVATLVLAGPTGIGPSATLAQDCLSQNEARAAVASGQAAPFSNFVGRLRSQGQVVSSCLSRRGGGYVYLVNIVQPNGLVTLTVINAITGQ